MRRLSRSDSAPCRGEREGPGLLPVLRGAHLPRVRLHRVLRLPARGLLLAADRFRSLFVAWTSTQIGDWTIKSAIALTIGDCALFAHTQGEGEPINLAEPFVRVPLEAFMRRHELTSGAWDLYLVYCFHRNKDDGRCDPSLKTLQAELKHKTGKEKSNYPHVTRLRSELVTKGWIRLLDRNAVELLVGDFPLPTVRNIAKKRNEDCEKTQTLPPKDCEKTQTSEEKFAKKRNEDCEKTQTFPAAPIYEPGKEPGKAAAAASGSSDTEAGSTGQEWRAEVCDQRFVQWVIAQRGYPPALIELVWRELQLECETQTRETGTYILPTKGELLDRLNRAQRRPVQPVLPEIGASIHEISNHSPPIPAEEVAALQAEYEAAQEEMRRLAENQQRKEA